MDAPLLCGKVFGVATFCASRPGGLASRWKSLAPSASTFAAARAPQTRAARAALAAATEGEAVDASRLKVSVRRGGASSATAVPNAVASLDVFPVEPASSACNHWSMRSATPSTSAPSVCTCCALGSSQQLSQMFRRLGAESDVGSGGAARSGQASAPPKTRRARRNAKLSEARAHNACTARASWPPSRGALAMAVCSTSVRMRDSSAPKAVRSFAHASSSPALSVRSSSRRRPSAAGSPSSSA
mmetsp:Transcript_8233/g.20749  ORF Transcript_8233/g.20749 Transcript_8233/m.20749 type:complete len:244 (+) Transcript_8233:562-1293(+)